MADVPSSEMAANRLRCSAGSDVSSEKRAERQLEGEERPSLPGVREGRKNERGDIKEPPLRRHNDGGEKREMCEETGDKGR